ncbi:hypothetical protein HDU76_006758 [Blyttiomyces sp. JEL0837]|nr:hypothetical protein HDU76_006758 [Blyttiomyces sp. JEL0837]
MRPITEPVSDDDHAFPLQLSPITSTTMPSPVSSAIALLENSSNRSPYTFSFPPPPPPSTFTSSLRRRSSLGLGLQSLESMNANHGVAGIWADKPNTPVVSSYPVAPGGPFHNMEGGVYIQPQSQVHGHQQPQQYFHGPPAIAPQPVYMNVRQQYPQHFSVEQQHQANMNTAAAIQMRGGWTANNVVVPGTMQGQQFVQPLNVNWAQLPMQGVVTAPPIRQASKIIPSQQSSVDPIVKLAYRTTRCFSSPGIPLKDVLPPMEATMETFSDQTITPTISSSLGLSIPAKRSPTPDLDIEGETDDPSDASLTSPEKPRPPGPGGPKPSQPPALATGSPKTTRDPKRRNIQLPSDTPIPSAIPNAKSKTKARPLAAATNIAKSETSKTSTTGKSSKLKSSKLKFRYGDLPKSARLIILSQLSVKDLARMRVFDRLASSESIWSIHLYFKYPSLHQALKLSEPTSDELKLLVALFRKQDGKASEDESGDSKKSFSRGVKAGFKGKRVTTKLVQVAAVLHSTYPNKEFWLQRAREITEWEEQQDHDDDDDEEEEKGKQVVKKAKDKSKTSGVGKGKKGNTSDAKVVVKKKRVITSGAAFAFAVMETGKKLAHGLRCDQCHGKPRNGESLWCDRCGKFACGPQNFIKRCQFAGDTTSGAFDMKMVQKEFVAVAKNFIALSVTLDPLEMEATSEHGQSDVVPVKVSIIIHDEPFNLEVSDYAKFQRQHECPPGVLRGCVVMRFSNMARNTALAGSLMVRLQGKCEIDISGVKVFTDEDLSHPATVGNFNIIRNVFYSHEQTLWVSETNHSTGEGSSSSQQPYFDAGLQDNQPFPFSFSIPLDAPVSTKVKSGRIVWTLQAIFCQSGRHWPITVTSEVIIRRVVRLPFPQTLPPYPPRISTPVSRKTTTKGRTNSGEFSFEVYYPDPVLIPPSNYEIEERDRLVWTQSLTSNRAASFSEEDQSSFVERRNERASLNISRVTNVPRKLRRTRRGNELRSTGEETDELPTVTEIGVQVLLKSGRVNVGAIRKITVTLHQKCILNVFDQFRVPSTGVITSGTLGLWKDETSPPIRLPSMAMYSSFTLNQGENSSNSATSKSEWSDDVVKSMPESFETADSLAASVSSNEAEISAMSSPISSPCLYTPSMKVSGAGVYKFLKVPVGPYPGHNLNGLGGNRMVNPPLLRNENLATPVADGVENAGDYVARIGSRTTTRYVVECGDGEANGECFVGVEVPITKKAKPTVLQQNLKIVHYQEVIINKENIKKTALNKHNMAREMHECKVKVPVTVINSIPPPVRPPLGERISESVHSSSSTS